MEKYKLTPAEIEDLEKRGFKPEELSKAKHKIYSLEDWLKGDPISLLLPGWGISPHYLDEKHNTVPKEKGELTLFILPESEWLKIEQYKEEKLKGFVLAYFEALVESFEIKEKGSFEPILLAESELGKVKDLIEDKFPKCTTGWIYTNLTLEKIPSIWLQYRNDCGDKSNLSYWFKKVCVNGENGVRYVRHRHTTLTANELNSLHPDDLHFVVSALAFHQFKAYLTSKLAEIDAPLPVHKAQIKSGYCCKETLKIMKGLVTRFDVTQTEVRHFEDFFHQHPYTNLDDGNKYRDKTTGDLDFEKLLTKIFDFASLFDTAIQDYFFTCYLEDAEEQCRNKTCEPDFYILKKKIEARRKTATDKMPESTNPKKSAALPPFQDVYNGSLNDLWRELSSTPKPLVSKFGKFTWEGETVSVLMALAQALVTAERINGEHKQESVYRMLCRHFETPETERPRIKAHTASGYTEVYSEYLTAFNDLFSE